MEGLSANYGLWVGHLSRGEVGPWARWHLGDREGGLDAMRRGIAACHDMGNVLFTTLFETALAETEAEAGEIEAALARIDHAGRAADHSRPASCAPRVRS